MAPSFVIVRVGVHSVEVPGLDELVQTMVMIIRSHPGNVLQVFGSDIEYSTIEQAQAHAETYGPIEWRASPAPLPDEQPCFSCRCTMGKLLEARERHPERICQVCALEAVDARGRRVCFGNTDAGGGLRGWYADTSAPYDLTDCFIRGIACRVSEARFGGVVIEPRSAGSRFTSP